ncbi:histidine--tRNA ligase [Synergistales bacterium]|nr:histidine--tRNA ligase [Synergistales bacterium]GHV52636.1 histidine--tRNA ligase [Synergistales bacterium]
MEMIKAPRGTKDVLGDESRKWAHVIGVCREVAEDFGYKEAMLPIFEHTELFSRGIGDATDVVEKEMYTFTDRGGRSVTLRPEMTASVMRSYLERDMSRLPQPVKVWGYGPMFRYERPQKGRYRQFWQVDFEILGSPSPLRDIEVIDTSMEIYRRLGINNLSVLINSVGCPKCRPAYRDALRGFISGSASGLGGLCETCRERFERNPLRILDCKNPECKTLTDSSPSMIDSLCGECREHFGAVTRGLAAIGASVSVDNRLVRGLDYYTKTAYEILAGELGSQNAVCGGGRYDNLAESIGGPRVPSVGFASGIERIVITLEGQGVNIGEEPKPRVLIVNASEEALISSVSLLHELRGAGLSADMDCAGRSLKVQMKRASSAGARFVCVIGEDELASGTVGIKDMSDGEQRTVSRNDAVSALQTCLLDWGKR